MNQAYKPFRETHPMPELLAPAGGPAPFDAALAAGADAIYCGFGNDFNARRGAENFDPESFSAACRRAHLVGTRVYVTVNVVVKDEEMERVLDLVRRVWALGADAFIIQDWGLMCEVMRRWPQIEVHVSTQANVQDSRATRWSRDLGVDRVTLSRELSMDEISTIAREGVELESFGHGALCFCYSGVCQMSSLTGNRSANRGLCAQPCRLPYDLVDEGGSVVSAPGRTKPLCPRDFCSFEDIDALAKTGVGSLKVEGRLKAPDYVYAVASSYRAQMDDVAAGMTPDSRTLESRRSTLKRAFNRDFTNSYLLGESGDEMMSYERSNNRGETVGEVVASVALEPERRLQGGARGGRKRMRTHGKAEVSIRLRKPVGEGDLLEIRPLDDPEQYLTALATSDARAGEVLRVTAARPMQRGCVVRLIRSKKIMDDAERVAATPFPRKRPVEVSVVALQGNSFTVGLRTTDGAHSVEAMGFVVEPAKTRAVTREDLVEHVGRMGTTPFEPVSFDVVLDEGCGMGFSAVHKVRSQACEMLEHAILADYEARALPELEPLTGSAAARVVAQPEICVIAPTPQVACAAVGAGATRVYASTDALSDASAWPEGTIPLLDEICREIDRERLDRWVQQGEACAVGNVSELVLAGERGAVAEVRGCIPVHNEEALRVLEDAGARGVWLSPELTLAEIRRLSASASVPVGLVVMGRTRGMTSEHCVLQVADRCVHDCERCGMRARRHYLRSKDGSLWPVQTDVHGRSRIYSAEPLDATPQADELLRAGVTRFAVDATLMDPDEAASAIRRVVRQVEAAQRGSRPSPRLPGHNSGHLFAGIE